MYKVYSHEKCNPEAEMYLICSCENHKSAQYIVDAFHYRDTSGRMDSSGMYDYYIKEEK